tara:strand:- start:2498 stop:4435 length:1938 start_codon:yes stop_codon:yes gene_type:complete
MIIELGLVFLILSVILSFFQFCHPIYQNLVKNEVFPSGITIRNARYIFFCTLFSFICLTYAFILSDFSLVITSTNSNSQLPLIYKITGVWGNHEGSILLWLLVMTFFGFIFSKHKIKDFDLKNIILSIQGALCFLIGLFILLTSNPFARNFPPNVEGRDLNPLLQDPGLAIHPPFLYLGYVGFSIVYSMAVGVLLKQKLNRDFILLIKPWIYISWIFLTCGIGLGSWWAYYELGWGGFWFWDPVENASLLPWLTGTALLHSIVVVEKKGELITWTLLLSILTFSLSLLGTFLVRSGVLVSVHAFANDPSRGLFILLLLIIICGLGFYIFIKYYKNFTDSKFIEPVSREGAISLNNIFMVTIAGTILLGTIYPLIADAFFKTKISVGAPFYNTVITPFIFPLIMGMMIGPFLKWNKDDIFKLVSRLKFLILSIFILSLFFWYIFNKGPIISVVFFTFAIWLIASSIYEIFSISRIQFLNKKKNFLRIPSKIIAQSTAHIGIAFIVIGATGGSVLKEEKIQFQRIGQVVEVSDYQLEFDGVNKKNIENYRSDFATFKLYKNNQFIKLLHPEKRYYNSGNQVTTEAAIYSTIFGDVYVAIGERNQSFKDFQSWTTRIWFNPYVLWIWLGVVFMSIGGFISLVKSYKKI